MVHVGSIPTRGTKGEKMNSTPEETEHWRKIAKDWQQTAEALAIDLGDALIAHELYDDISSGLYEKVRSRLTHDPKPSGAIDAHGDEDWFDLIPDSSKRGL